MNMKLMVLGIEPAVDEKRENESLNVTFVSNLSHEEFDKLRRSTKIWNIEVEVKDIK